MYFENKTSVQILTVVRQKNKIIRIGYRYSQFNGSGVIRRGVCGVSKSTILFGKLKLIQCLAAPRLKQISIIHLYTP